jgi:hypothetical protein
MNVICPEYVKTIRLDAEWRAEVIVKQTLVFLDRPGREHLQDTCAAGPGADLDTFIWRSDDASEIRRRLHKRNAVVVDWRPNGAVVPFALHGHQYSWRPIGSQAAPALCTELQCEMKTGLFQFEIAASEEFESAVVFERPRWWRFLNTERKLIKYALKQLEMPAAGVGQAAVADGGRRIAWKILGPKVGARFIAVAFRRHGMAIWQDRLQKTSFGGRARQLIGRPATP